MEMDLKDLPVAVIVDRWPEAAPIFAKHRIDLCCGGRHTLEQVAEIKGLDLKALVRQIEAVRHEPQQT